MNRENEEQRPVPQTLCGALQKEPNCKCLVLSVLIYGCLAAVTWCRCANVTKIVINFSKNPIRSTKHVSPCDDGYIYIPVAFMGMLYLVYLVECYHSPIRLDLLHAESQDSVLSKLAQLRMARPTIWWKAVSYHYVRRKRQITRYRNGDNYTTTQVYYERVNTHAATSYYYYDYCGVKDISKELILDPKIPITKIALSKGFAFSNLRSATEFEEARSRFFAEQELRDDYMEMREGLDLGCNLDPVTLVAVLGNPWFTSRCVYWCLSALLLSWPLRVIIEYKTQYVDYQVTKLFGVNYDTPLDGELIQTSNGQLSQPGSYMLAPSYSEALLMDPAPCVERRGDFDYFQSQTNVENALETEMVPSYSEALLYERATSGVLSVATGSEAGRPDEPITCNCGCHHTANVSQTKTEGQNDEIEVSCLENSHENKSNCTTCEKTLNESTKEVASVDRPEAISEENITGNILLPVQRENTSIPRGTSEPNLRARLKTIAQTETLFLGANGRSLDNVLENDTEARRFEMIPENTIENAETNSVGTGGAIPKRIKELRSRVTINPMAEEATSRKLPLSKTYLSLKSILKQNKRRYTLITPCEFKLLVDDEEENIGGSALCTNANDTESSPVSRESLNGVTNPRKRQFYQNLILSSDKIFPPVDRKTENDRTLIFANPIQEIYPRDPFGGKNVVSSTKNEGSFLEDTLSSPTTTLLDCNQLSSNQAEPSRRHCRLSYSDNSEPPNSSGFSLTLNNDLCENSINGHNEIRSTVLRSNEHGTDGRNLDRTGRFVDRWTFSLTRSFTERRPYNSRRSTNVRRSFAEDYRSESGRRMNLNMETSL